MVIWTAHGARDLRLIFDFIAADSRFYARKVTDEIVAKTEILERFPQVGRMVPELQRPEIRELIIESYRTIYKVLANRDVEILTILHGRQQFPAEKFDRE